VEGMNFLKQARVLEKGSKILFIRMVSSVQNINQICLHKMCEHRRTHYRGKG
jgi:hypothetical protein